MVQQFLNLQAWVHVRKATLWIVVIVAVIVVVIFVVIVVLLHVYSYTVY